MKSARDLFDSMDSIETFKRVASTHPLDLFCGYDQFARQTLLLLSPNKPMNLNSSQIIKVDLGMRISDNKWALSFSLADNAFTDLFQQFCDDLITASQNLEGAEAGTEFICSRYLKWQEMLSAVKNYVLSRSEIKGLIGEMIFLKDILIPLYGIPAALKAWIGPEKADQDFVFPNTWYEVKAITSDAEHVRISSIEQLDCQDNGTLAILALDPTSSVDEFGITVNRLYHELAGTIATETLKTTFNNLLLKNGFYPRPEYDEYVFRLKGIRQYHVGKDFPCLRRANIPGSVANVSWTLILAAISPWLDG